jgi:hypothetical protein
MQIVTYVQSYNIQSMHLHIISNLHFSQDLSLYHLRLHQTLVNSLF